MKGPVEFEIEFEFDVVVESMVHGPRIPSVSRDEQRLTAAGGAQARPKTECDSMREDGSRKRKALAEMERSLMSAGSEHSMLSM